MISDLDSTLVYVILVYAIVLYSMLNSEAWAFTLKVLWN